MKREANFEIITSNKVSVTINDIGPWDKHPSVTNDAERVVERMIPVLQGRRLFYYDSEGERAELIIKNGRFDGFLLRTFDVSCDGKFITCHLCGRTSHNLNDVANHYCGHCHVFHDEKGKQ